MIIGSWLACTKRPPPLPEPPADPFAGLRAHLDGLADTGHWSGSVVVTHRGAPWFAHAVGRRGPDDPQPVDRETQFRVGAITQLFTSVVVHQLADEGRLSLDTPLATWFPGVPNAADITIADLLQHRSGLRHVHQAPGYARWRHHPIDDDALLARIASQRPGFEPRAETATSSSNYVLLGLVVAAVEARPLAELVETRIVAPLELTGTGLGSVLSDNHAIAMSWTDGTWMEVPQTHPSVLAGSRALVSTPRDLCTFAHALFGGELVSEASLRSMQTLDGVFGRGLFRLTFGDRETWGHTGGVDGFRARMIHDPARDVCMALASHTDDTDVNELTVAILDALEDR
ncbi:MAG: serine hydrolase domain-containing protein [Myxococcota bacterium]